MRPKQRLASHSSGDAATPAIDRAALPTAVFLENRIRQGLVHVAVGFGVKPNDPKGSSNQSKSRFFMVFGFKMRGSIHNPQNWSELKSPGFLQLSCRRVRNLSYIRFMSFDFDTAKLTYFSIPANTRRQQQKTSKKVSDTKLRHYATDAPAQLVHSWQFSFIFPPTQTSRYVVKHIDFPKKTNFRVTFRGSEPHGD